MVWQRLRAIFQANWDEEPTAAQPASEVSEALRGMEQAVVRARQETARVMAEARVAALRLEEHRRQASWWQEQAERAVLAGADDRARTALRNRKECDIIVAVLEEQETLAGQASQSMHDHLEQLQLQLEEARLQAGVLQARQQAAEARRRLADLSVRSDAFGLYDRLRARIDRAEAEADALRELHGSADLPTRADDAPTDGTVLDDALGELKRRLEQG